MTLYAMPAGVNFSVFPELTGYLFEPELTVSYTWTLLEENGTLMPEMAISPAVKSISHL